MTPCNRFITNRKQSSLIYSFIYQSIKSQPFVKAIDIFFTIKLSKISKRQSSPVSTQSGASVATMSRKHKHHSSPKPFIESKRFGIRITRSKNDSGVSSNDNNDDDNNNTGIDPTYWEAAKLATTNADTTRQHSNRINGVSNDDDNVNKNNETKKVRQSKKKKELLDLKKQYDKYIAEMESPDFKIGDASTRKTKPRDDDERDDDRNDNDNNETLGKVTATIDKLLTKTHQKGGVKGKGKGNTPKESTSARATTTTPTMMFSPSDMSRVSTIPPTPLPPTTPSHLSISTISSKKQSLLSSRFQNGVDDNDDNNDDDNENGDTYIDTTFVLANAVNSVAASKTMNPVDIVHTPQTKAMNEQETNDIDDNDHMKGNINSSTPKGQENNDTDALMNHDRDDGGNNSDDGADNGNDDEEEMEDDLFPGAIDDLLNNDDDNIDENNSVTNVDTSISVEAVTKKGVDENDHDDNEDTEIDATSNFLRKRSPPVNSRSSIGSTRSSQSKQNENLNQSQNQSHETNKKLTSPPPSLQSQSRQQPQQLPPSASATPDIATIAAIPLPPTPLPPSTESSKQINSPGSSNQNNEDQNLGKTNTFVSPPLSNSAKSNASYAAPTPPSIESNLDEMLQKEIDGDKGEATIHIPMKKKSRKDESMAKAGTGSKEKPTRNDSDNDEKVGEDEDENEMIIHDGNDEEIFEGIDEGIDGKKNQDRDNLRTPISMKNDATPGAEVEEDNIDDNDFAQNDNYDSDNDGDGGGFELQSHSDNEANDDENFDKNDKSDRNDDDNGGKNGNGSGIVHDESISSSEESEDNPKSKAKKKKKKRKRKKKGKHEVQQKESSDMDHDVTPITKGGGGGRPKRSKKRVRISTKSESLGYQVGNRNYKTIPASNFEEKINEGKEDEESKNKNVRRSSRRKFPPLEFWKNERVVYEANNESGVLAEVFGDMPVVSGILTAEPTPYKKRTITRKRKIDKDDDDSESNASNSREKKTQREKKLKKFDSSKLRKVCKFGDFLSFCAKRKRLIYLILPRIISK